MAQERAQTILPIEHDPLQFRAACDAARSSGKVVGLVPTMGALHAGHAALIARAAADGRYVAVTIFVNPTQFGPKEDFSKYPRTLDADARLAAEAGASIVFAPETSAMYPPGDETRVRVGRTAEALCGEHRPGHFEGVATVVAKLFSLVGPCFAYFGRKDYQQLRVIERMQRDLFMPVTIVPVATIREPDGLAMSSRNRYLAPEDRERARAIPQALSLAIASFDAGERNVQTLQKVCRDHLDSVVDSIDYVTLADANTVVPLDPNTMIAGRAVLAVAVRISGTRLIDNVVLGDDPAPSSSTAAVGSGKGSVP